MLCTDIGLRVVSEWRHRVSQVARMYRANCVSIMATNRVQPLISLREDDVPGANIAHPSVVDNSLSKSRGGWSVEASKWAHAASRDELFKEDSNEKRNVNSCTIGTRGSRDSDWDTGVRSGQWPVGQWPVGQWPVGQWRCYLQSGHWPADNVHSDCMASALPGPYGFFCFVFLIEKTHFHVPYT